jgi:hypothetical protein
VVAEEVLVMEEAKVVVVVTAAEKVAALTTPTKTPARVSTDILRKPGGE